MEKSNNDFIREYREKLKLTQREFAEKFRIPVGTLRLWEQGRTVAPDYLVMLLKERETYTDALNAINSAIKDNLSQITQAVQALDNIDPQSFLDKPMVASSGSSDQMTLFDVSGMINAFTEEIDAGCEKKEDAGTDTLQLMSKVSYNTSNDSQIALVAEQAAKYGRKEKDT